MGRSSIQQHQTQDITYQKAYVDMAPYSTFRYHSTVIFPKCDIILFVVALRRRYIV